MNDTPEKGLPSRLRLYRKNVVWAAGLQLINTAAMLIVPRITIASYGSASNGLVSSLTQMLTMLLVVEAGLTSAAMFALFEPLAKGDRDWVSRLMGSVERLYRQVGWIFLFLSLVLALVYSGAVSVPDMKRYDVFFLVLILGANGAVDFFFYAKFRVLLQASQHSYVVSKASSLQLIASTLAIYVVALVGGSLIFGRILAGFALLVKFLILRHSVRHMFKLDKVNQASALRIPQRRDVLLQQILGSVQIGIPVVFATVFTDLESVSVLAVYMLVSQGLVNVLSVLTSGAVAGLGDMYARNLGKGLRRVYSDLEFLYSNASSILFGVGAAMIVPFMGLYVGRLDSVDYERPLLGILTCVNGWLYSVKAPQGAMVIAAGHFRQTRSRVIVQASIIVVLGLVLTPFYGIMGVMLASLTSNLYRVVDMLHYVPRRLVRLPVRFGWSRLVRSAFIGSATFVVIYSLSPGLTNWFMFLSVGLVGVGVGLFWSGLSSIVWERRAFGSLRRRILRRF